MSLILSNYSGFCRPGAPGTGFCCRTSAGCLASKDPPTTMLADKRPG